MAMNKLILPTSIKYSKYLHTITIKGDKPMVVIRIEEYESMKETIELLSVNPDMLQELKEERRKMNEGDFISFEDFKKKYKIK